MVFNVTILLALYVLYFKALVKVVKPLTAVRSIETDQDMSEQSEFICIRNVLHGSIQYVGG